MTSAEIKDRLRNARFGRLEELSKHVLAVYSQRPGDQVLREIQTVFKKEKAKYIATPVRGSAYGFVQVQDYQIIAKPLGKTRLKLKHGKDNETNLVAAINTAIELNGDPIDLVFTDTRGRRFDIKKAYKAVHTAKDVVGDKKADVVIKTSGGTDVPISLKKDNAEFWGSAAKLWGKKALWWIEKLVAEKKIKLIERDGYVEIEPKFAVPANIDEIRKIVFGSDLYGKGFVLERSFSDADFQFNNDTESLAINCSVIIQSIMDLSSKHKPWFVVLNEKARKVESLPKGLRVLAVYEQRVTLTMLKITTH